MTRSISRAGAALGAALVVVALSAAPAFACGGLIGPNGAVNLLRTTTLAGYHNGDEHYITAFQFAGGGGSFGSLTPLPGDPVEGREGRRLDPPAPHPRDRSVAEGNFLRLAAPAAAGSAEELMKVRIDALDITVLRGGPDEVGNGPPIMASASHPTPRRCSTSTRPAPRSSWQPSSTPTRRRSAARPSATGPRST